MSRDFCRGGPRRRMPTSTLVELPGMRAFRADRSGVGQPGPPSSPRCGRCTMIAEPLTRRLPKRVERRGVRCPPRNALGRNSVSQMNRRRALQTAGRARRGRTSPPRAAPDGGDRRPPSGPTDQDRPDHAADRGTQGDRRRDGQRLPALPRPARTSSSAAPGRADHRRRGRDPGVGQAAVERLLKQDVLALTGVVDSAVMLRPCGTPSSRPGCRSIGSNASPTEPAERRLHLAHLVRARRAGPGARAVHAPRRAAGRRPARHRRAGGPAAATDVVKGFREAFGAADRRLTGTVIWTTADLQPEPAPTSAGAINQALQPAPGRDLLLLRRHGRGGSSSSSCAPPATGRPSTRPASSPRATSSSELKERETRRASRPR